MSSVPVWHQSSYEMLLKFSGKDTETVVDGEMRSFLTIRCKQFLGNGFAFLHIPPRGEP